MKALETLGELASFLDTEEFTDETSRAQRRAFRKAADALRATLEEDGFLTPPMLVCFWKGAACQAEMTKANNTDGAVTISTELTLMVAYLARDLLANERVEG